MDNIASKNLHILCGRNRTDIYQSLLALHIDITGSPELHWSIPISHKIETWSLPECDHILCNERRSGEWDSNPHKVIYPRFINLSASWFISAGCRSYTAVVVFPTVKSWSVTWQSLAIGVGNGTWTRTALPPADFKSALSASSIIPT